MPHSANFLHAQEPAPVRRRHGAKRTLLVAAIVLLVALLAYGAWVAVALGALYAAASDGRAALERARDDAERLDFDAALPEVRFAHDRFSAASTHSLALVPLEALPYVGADMKAARALALSGAEVSDALTSVIELGGDLVRLSGWTPEDLSAAVGGASPSLGLDQLPGATKQAMLRRFAASADELDRVSARMAIAEDDLARVPESEVAGPVLEALGPVRAKVGQLSRAVAAAARMARVLPAFAGAEGQKTTMLLFLNNAELRPGGGFIGSYGLLTVKDADIAALETHDSYDVDRSSGTVVTPPPPPLARYLGVDRWYFRDANWSPDFAASSATALQLFGDEERAAGKQPTAFDGAIGLTPTFVADLLRLTGPIEAGGQRFTAENVADEIEYQVEVGYAKDGTPYEQRKEVLAELVDRMKEKLYALPRSRWGELSDAVARAVSGKQLMFYAVDPKAERAVSAAGWGATLPAPTWGDAVMAVDANLASLKTDPTVKRSVRYDVSRTSSGQYAGRVTIHYDHAGHFDWKTTRYRTYARVLVPAGSTFVRVTGALKDDRVRDPAGTPGTADVGIEGGFASFGAFTSVEPGQSRDLTFEFLLAPAVADAIRSGQYRLQVFKQPGAADAGLTLHLDFDKNVTDASVPEDRSKWGDDAYDLSTTLDQDRTFEVKL